MVRRGVLVPAVLAALFVLLPVAAAHPARAAAQRTVSARLECARVMGDTSGLPNMKLTIENQTGAPLSVVYARAFGNSPDLELGVTGMAMELTPAEPAREIANGKTATLEPEWAGVALRRSDKIVALVLTNAGALLPACGDEQPRTLSLGVAPSGNKAKSEEAVRIGAEMIGQLEAWRAYPALYALMHPDGQTAVSFKQMSCWYLGQFGPPVKNDAKSIYSTEITAVKLLDWTWGVTGARYKNAAEVSQTQRIGVSEKQAEPDKSTIHLVQVDGVWRWFFGSTPEGVAGLSDACKLPATV